MKRYIRERPKSSQRPVEALDKDPDCLPKGVLPGALGGWRLRATGGTPDMA
jgi:hypothetical protein